MDWIQGEKFKMLGDFTYSPAKKRKDDYDNLPNTFSLDVLFDGCFVYTHTIYAKELFIELKKSSKGVTVITHNGDINIDDTFLIPDNVLYWYSQNVNTKNPKLEAIPIGLENDRWFKGLKKKEKMLGKLSERKKCRNLVYMNHNINTNPSKRFTPYYILENKKWVTSERGVNGENFDNYLNNIYNHTFVICPEGNGIDTHRVWETLYMKSFPIMKRNINHTCFFSDFPICFVDDWEQVTEDFLNDQLTLMNILSHNIHMLDFSWWKNYILE